MKIKQIKPSEVPYELLYLADEDDLQIAKYRDKSLFWGAEEEGTIIGIVALLSHSSESAEIPCIAVNEEFQNRKIGTELIERVISYSKEKGYKEIIIKTGNCGIMQLYLYQRCGFRFDSINKDYFKAHYGQPIFEKSIPCVDQIVLKYRIYSAAELDEIIGLYWNRFIEKHKEYSGRSYCVRSFYFGEELPNKQLALVKEKKITASTSVPEAFSPEVKIPEPEDLSIITYGNGLPGCIIKSKELRRCKFCEITEEEARLEGEADLSLEKWRKDHYRIFKTLSDEIPVIFEQFEVVYDEDWW